MYRDIGIGLRTGQCAIKVCIGYFFSEYKLIPEISKSYYRVRHGLGLVLVSTDSAYAPSCVCTNRHIAHTVLHVSCIAYAPIIRRPQVFAAPAFLIALIFYISPFHFT